ncbi:unnamed protein product [Vitrella brassicaformis CCMP3155]|uniref:Uncharacterized protein n=1 Tax=Vitrella brassicaformis (strain CCMP3155) TaxID=1169540 RepID=A0A0G4FS91_VITBC|nr:unnamed protein product [Vitrella brassicaformis CCMP3155]|eukprot:CEM17239.1 unnamed protein product [Vitrella brassicaformis CCMP3155]
MMHCLNGTTTANTAFARWCIGAEVLQVAAFLNSVFATHHASRLTAAKKTAPRRAAGEDGDLDTLLATDVATVVAEFKKITTGGQVPHTTTSRHNRSGARVRHGCTHRP